MMELYKDILQNLLADCSAEVTFSGFPANVNEIVEMRCYRVLQKIKAIIEDKSLEDDECFMKIEEIICALESIGSNGGFRHDFG